MIPPARGQKFKSIRVGGIRLVHESDWKKKIAPLNANQGYVLGIIGHFPGAVHTVTGIQINKAVTNTGTSLLKDDQPLNMKWNIRLSKDKSVVIFDIKLNPPDEKVQRINEISGTVTYNTAGGEKLEEIGLVDLKRNASAKKLGIKIQDVSKLKWVRGKYQLRLKIDVPKDNIKEIRLTDTQGKPIDMKQTGKWGFSNSVTLTCQKVGEFPARAKLTVVMYGELKTYITPFTIGKIDLLGRPVK